MQATIAFSRAIEDNEIATLLKEAKSFGKLCTALAATRMHTPGGIRPLTKPVLLFVTIPTQLAGGWRNT